jgi:hypothetical protein
MKTRLSIIFTAKEACIEVIAALDLAKRTILWEPGSGHTTTLDRKDQPSLSDTVVCLICGSIRSVGHL